MVFKAKDHNLIVDEKTEKKGILQYIHLYFPFALLILLCVFTVIIKILEHSQNILGIYRKL